jgi:hypothetical protein
MALWWRHVNWTLIALTVSAFMGTVFVLIIAAKLMGLI